MGYHDIQFDVISLFPEMLSGLCKESMIGRAQQNGLIKIQLHNLRNWATGPHNVTDDRPFGGGAGMVLKPEPVFAAVEELKQENTEVIYMTPDGQQLSTEVAKELSKKKHLLFISGHYEGLDQRVRDNIVDRELSIGDYVLTNGTLAAAVAIDCISRFVPGFLGDNESLSDEAFSSGQLSHPQYTRPAKFREWEVPSVLLSGDHKKIEAWRNKSREEKTLKRRPDLLKN